MSRNRDLTKGSVKDHIKAIAIPASIGFFFNTMYNVVDTIYAGILSTQAQAALALSFPIFFIILAMGSGIGTAASVLISNSLGERKQPGMYATQSISFAIIISIVVAIIGFLVSPWLFSLLGASAEYLEMSLEYMNIILLAAPFFMLSMTLNQCLTAQGDSKSFRNYLIIGFFLNLLFNPLFMFGFGFIPAMGIGGIALATVAIQIIGVIYLSFHLKKTGILDKRKGKDYIPQFSFMKEISYQAFPASLNMMMVALGVLIITYFVSDFGKAAVAAYGIATRIEQILLLPTIGLNFAVLSLVGQNNGAKKFNRVKKAFYTSLRYGLYLMTASTIILFFFAPLLMRIFTDDTEVINIAVPYLRIAAFLTWGYVVLFQTTAMLQGLKRPMFALWISLFRQVLAPIFFFWLFIEVFDMGIFGIWWGIFALIWVSMGIALWYGFRVFKKKVLKKV